MQYSNFISLNIRGRVFNKIKYNRGRLGDYIDNLNCHIPVIELLQQNFEDYYQKFTKSIKTVIDDKRVHLCLYFLEPIFLIKVADLEALKAISKYSIVIPVIAKADLIPISTMSEIRIAHRNILKDYSIPLFSGSENELSIPYLIFLQERQDTSGYSWCNYPVQSSKINDFLTLKRLILEKSISLFNKETDRFYDN